MSVSSAVYLHDLIPDGDHDRRGDPTTRQAAYALAIGATANIMFVIGATAMLLVFALAYARTTLVGSQRRSIELADGPQARDYRRSYH